MDADELYRLPPEDFTAARDAAAKQAKADGDKDAAAALKALRKPSVPAHLVNLLAHQEADLLEQLLALGPALAQAQAQGQGDALRTLGAQRRELVEAVTARAVELGGREVSAGVREEVAGTLEAALADPASAEAVRSGRLVRPLSYIGFGDVDLSGAVAPAPAASTTKKKDDPDRELVAAAEQAALEAAGRLDDAVRACERAQREHERAEEHAAGAHDEVERLRAALQQAERAARDADGARTKAAKAADQAVAAVRRAQDREERARAELDRLRRGS